MVLISTTGYFFREHNFRIEDDLMRIAMFGDVIGQPGRTAAMEKVRELKTSGKVDFVVLNGENAAGGIGLTPEIGHDILRSGADVITSGNHIWNKKDMVAVLNEERHILRPYNYPKTTPGRGFTAVNCDGYRLGVLNLQGRTFMQAIDCPFKSADEVIDAYGSEVDAIVVDFHAEATSEKQALGMYLDGRVSAVVGTHTHVQTADERILTNGTAYITDLGMCGPVNSVIGMSYETSIAKFLSGTPTRFEVAKGQVMLCYVVIDIDHSTGKARSIDRIMDVG